MLIKRVAFSVLATIALTSAAQALTLVPVADTRLVDRADAIVRGRVVGSTVGTETGRVMTSYEVQVLSALKDPGVDSSIVVRALGGVDLERGLAVKIFGVPEWKTGDTLLLFLTGAEDGSFRVVHFVQGAFRERRLGRDRSYQRAGADVFEVARTGPESEGAGGGSFEIRRLEPLPRSADLFESWIVDRLAGSDRSPDYLMSETAAPQTTFTSPFTQLAGDDLLLRWTEFDDGKKVGWHRHVDGQEGYSGGAAAEFKKARRAWKKKFSGVPIRLTNKGKTSSTTGFTASDDRNTLLHSDFNESIGEDFECPGGGVLAIGGVSGTDFFPTEFKDESALRIREAEIVMNDGIECFLEGNKKLVAQIYAHELGHTLGLGHSCGDDFSPNCSKSDFLAEALMVANLDNIFGAKIRDDDVLGARQLYDEDFWAAACETRVPGATSFCKKCGPCGEGQGNCKRDSDCFGNLVCTKDVGAGFGFDPGVNVCTDG